MTIEVGPKPQRGGVRARASRWRCAVGWLVYLLAAVVVVLLVGAAPR